MTDYPPIEYCSKCDIGMNYNYFERTYKCPDCGAKKRRVKKTLKEY